MIKFFKKLSPSVALLVVMSVISFCWLYQNERLKAEIVRLKENYAAEQLAIANSHASELERQSALNDELTRQLIGKQHEITQQLQQLESAIDDAIKKDGAAYNGIGADSLCVYKRAYGYDCK